MEASLGGGATRLRFTLCCCATSHMGRWPPMKSCHRFTCWNLGPCLSLSHTGVPAHVVSCPHPACMTGAACGCLEHWRLCQARAVTMAQQWS